MPTKKKKKATSGTRTPVGNVVAYAAEQAGITQVAARNALIAAFAQIKAEVAAGNKVSIRAFGTFKKRTYAGRTIRTPQGKKVTYRTRSRVAFKATAGDNL